MHSHARTSSTSALSAIDFAWAKLHDARERKRDERENAALYPAHAMKFDTAQLVYPTGCRKFD